MFNYITHAYWSLIKCQYIFCITKGVITLCLNHYRINLPWMNVSAKLVAMHFGISLYMLNAGLQ